MLIEIESLVALYLLSIRAKAVRYEQFDDFCKQIDAHFLKTNRSLPLNERVNPVFLYSPFYLKKLQESKTFGLDFFAISLKEGKSASDLKEILKPLPKEFLKPAKDFSRKYADKVVRKTNRKEYYLREWYEIEDFERGSLYSVPQKMQSEQKNSHWIL